MDSQIRPLSRDHAVPTTSPRPPRRSVVIAPDSFKGSVSARAAAEAIAAGWRRTSPQDSLRLLPIADGGEGTLDAVEKAVPGSTRVAVPRVHGPDGRPTRAEWLRLRDGTGVIELASSSGLPLMSTPDALGATTRGLGDVIRSAIASGVDRLVIGLGGSASTDGGAGALAALGMRLLDDSGRLVGDGGGALLRLASIDPSGLVEAPARGVEVLVDVDAPLFGPTGAAAVYGPQKGAAPADVRTLDDALRHWSTFLGGRPEAAGSGAAGGTAYGLAAAWGARIESGAHRLAAITGLDDAIRESDIVIAGEGRLDHQSRRGKIVGHIERLAQEAGARLIVIAGQVATRSKLETYSLTALAGSPERAIREPERWLRHAASRAASTRA